jgi:DNA ligase D-like protein (predicted 3'-phosphoesterase)
MPRFVIHQHDATHMHYDLRIEIGGVYKSWAVPKGLSTNPKDKRLAVQVLDHPLSYGKFEGMIPEGEYGAGPVLIWDRGKFRNLKDESLEKCYRQGHVEVWLEGEKLHGGYALVRFKEEAKQWLVIKMRDSEADARRNPVKTQPKSVVSGLTIKQIRSNARHHGA